jgi:hypothetical protein
VRKVYLDPGLLVVVGAAGSIQPDPRVVLAVRRAMRRLSDRQREIIEARFGECLTFKQIGIRLGLTPSAVRIDYYAAVRALKHHLASFVERRWRVKADGLCRICSHPKRVKIEEMLRAKSGRETWGAFGRRLEVAIGERFQPPRILISHLGHMGENNGRH